MTHDELQTLLLWAMSGKVHFDARESFALFVRTKATSFFMNYDWVKRKEFWEKSYTDPRLDVGLGGTFGTRIHIKENTM